MASLKNKNPRWRTGGYFLHRLCKSSVLAEWYCTTLLIAQVGEMPKCQMCMHTKKHQQKCRAYYSRQTKDDLVIQYFSFVQIVAILPDRGEISEADVCRHITPKTFAEQEI